MSSKKGFFTTAVSFVPPTASKNASTLPSPPSATGMLKVSHDGNISATASFIRVQMRAELIVPLNESGISKIFFKAQHLSPLYKKRKNENTDNGSNTNDKRHHGLRFVTVFGL